MTDESKASVLSVAQFREQLEQEWYYLPIDALSMDWICARYAEARQASAWQPIESAPKEAVLLYRPGMNPRDRVSIRRASDWCGESCCPSAKPTLWMPIPVLEDDAHE